MIKYSKSVGKMPEDADNVELYNLNKDPNERNNLVG